MEPKNNNLSNLQQRHHQLPLPEEISDDQTALNVSAHTQAEKDMDKDAELSAQSANDDLDEGETARLGEDIPEII